jgi:hypothetical protein
VQVRAGLPARSTVSCRAITGTASFRRRRQGFLAQLACEHVLGGTRSARSSGPGGCELDLASSSHGVLIQGASGDIASTANTIANSGGACIRLTSGQRSTSSATRSGAAAASRSSRPKSGSGNGNSSEASLCSAYLNDSGSPATSSSRPVAAATKNPRLAGGFSLRRSWRHAPNLISRT